MREQAQAQGVDPALIEALYKSMIDHFIQRELKRNSTVIFDRNIQPIQVWRNVILGRYSALQAFLF